MIVNKFLLIFSSELKQLIDSGLALMTLPPQTLGCTIMATTRFIQTGNLVTHSLWTPTTVLVLPLMGNGRVDSVLSKATFSAWLDVS